MPWSLRMTMTAFFAALIPFLYVFWRYGVSLSYYLPDYQRGIRYTLLAMLVYINLLPLTIGFYYLTGHLRDLFIFRNTLGLSDYLINFPFWIGLITIVEVLPYLLVVDLFGLGSKIFSYSESISFKNWIHAIRLTIVPVIFLFVLVTSYLDTYTIRTSDYTIRLNDRPAENKNLTLGLVADLQVDRYTQSQKINNLLEISRKNEFDLLFFAGDLVTRGPDYIDQGVATLCSLKAPIRAACIGDHDIWSDADKISNDLTSCSWKVLQNQHNLIRYEGLRILITGVTYAYSQRISRPNLEQLLASAPEADIKIMLVHQPAKMILNAARKSGYNIFLAGHTHGGQVIFKPFGITLTPTQAENEIYAGYTPLDNLNVFISNGIGLTMMPLRFRAFAEFVKINVVF